MWLQNAFVLCYDLFVFTSFPNNYICLFKLLMNVQIVFLETDLYTVFQSGNSWFWAWQSAGINKIKFSSIYLTLHLLTLSFYCKNCLYFFNHCSESLGSSGKKNECRNPECCRPHLMKWTLGSQSYLDKFKHPIWEISFIF